MGCRLRFQELHLFDSEAQRHVRALDELQLPRLELLVIEVELGELLTGALKCAKIRCKRNPRQLALEVVGELRAIAGMPKRSATLMRGAIGSEPRCSVALSRAYLVIFMRGKEVAAMSVLLQADADELRTMPKRLTKAALAEFGMPLPGEGRTFQLASLDGRTEFLIDMNRRGKIKLTRCSYLERYRVIDVLARLDIDGPPHTNPLVASAPLADLVPYIGVTVPCPHFHRYVEGYEDRWAIPAAAAGFTQTTDLIAAMREFMTACGVEVVPMIQYPMQ